MINDYIVKLCKLARRMARTKKVTRYTDIEDILAEAYDSLPPPADFSPEDAAKFFVQAFMVEFKKVNERKRVEGERLIAESEMMTKVADLAAAAGCPSDAAVIPWLEGKGLIRCDGDQIVFVVDPGPRQLQPPAAKAS